MTHKTTQLNKERINKVNSLTTLKDVENSVASLKKTRTMTNMVLFSFALFIVPLGLVALVVPGVLFGILFWFLWKKVREQFFLEVEAHEARLEEIRQM